MQIANIRARIAFTIVFILGLCLSFYLYHTFNKIEQRKQSDRMQAHANRLAMDIESELKRRYLQINAVGNLFLSSQSVSFAEYSDFIERVYEDFPNDRRVTWLAEIPLERRAEFVETIRQNPQPQYRNFRLFELKDGQIMPTKGENGVIRSLIYTFPKLKSDNFVGRALGSHSPIMSRLAPALKKDGPSVSSIWLAPPPIEPKPIFLIFQPINARDDDSLYTGMLTSSNFLASSFKNAVPDEKTDFDFQYRLVDHKNNAYLYPQDVIAPLNDERFADRSPLSFPIQLIDRQWFLELYPISGVDNAPNRLLQALFIAGVLMSLLIAFLVHSMLTKQQKLSLLVQQQTEKLSDAVEQLENKNAQLHEAIIKANEAAKTKANFLANMSHEIRTPMNGISGMVDLCLQTDLDNKQNHYLQNIQICAKHLTTVINDILDLSKLESGKLLIEDHPFTLTSVLNSLKASILEAAQQKGLSFTIKTQPQLCIDLIGDGNRLTQVLLNLCSNAVKFTEQGSILLQISESEADEDDYCDYHFAVTDTGIGIAGEDIDNLFNAFTQHDASTTRKYGGTGLGLSISRRLCRLMHGDISVDSELGKGSCFTATIRVKRNVEVIIPGQNRPKFPRPLKLLSLEDNLTASEILDQQLTQMGAEVTALNHPVETLEKFDQGYWCDAIILDWAMQEMNGFHFIKALISRVGNNIPPIVILSAYSKEVIHSENRHSAVMEVLQKPCTVEQLHKAIVTVVDSSTAHPAEKPIALAGLKILVAEDNPINRMVINEILKQNGAEVEQVEDGKECVELLKHNSAFDLVLMDIQMPVMDGIEATKIIREELLLDALPIIAVTANVMEHDIASYLSKGMNAHVCKPIETPVLLDTIGKLLP